MRGAMAQPPPRWRRLVAASARTRDDRLRRAKAVGLDKQKGPRRTEGYCHSVEISQFRPVLVVCAFRKRTRSVPLLTRILQSFRRMLGFSDYRLQPIASLQPACTVIPCHPWRSTGPGGARPADLVAARSAELAAVLPARSRHRTGDPVCPGPCQNNERKDCWPSAGRT
jgi:hypothetical protein